MHGNNSSLHRSEPRTYRLLIASVITRRNALPTKISIVAAVQVAVLGLPGAENYRRVSAPVMSLPLASSRISSAVRPGDLFSTALAVAPTILKGLHNFLRSESILVRHLNHT